MFSTTHPSGFRPAASSVGRRFNFDNPHLVQKFDEILQAAEKSVGEGGKRKKINLG